MKIVWVLLVSIRLFAEEWVIPSNEEALAKLQKALAHQSGDHIERRVSRSGNRILEFEGFISSEADQGLLPKILADMDAYPRWVLKNINERPQGGKYYVQLLELKKIAESPPLLRSKVMVTFPLFQKTLVTQFKVVSESKNGVTSWLVESLPDEQSVVYWANAVVKVFPVKGNSNRVWGYMKAAAKVRNWLLYEALPEKMLMRETVERLGILMNNYLAEEDFRINQATTRKAATATSDGIKSPEKKWQ